LIDDIVEEDVTLGVDVGRNKVILKAGCSKDSGSRNGNRAAIETAVVRSRVSSIEGIVNF
jgi:hypothetical protein